MVFEQKCELAAGSQHFALPGMPAGNAGTERTTGSELQELFSTLFDTCHCYVMSPWVCALHIFRI